MGVLPELGKALLAIVKELHRELGVAVVQDPVGQADALLLSDGGRTVERDAELAENRFVGLRPVLY